MNKTFESSDSFWYDDQTLNLGDSLSVEIS